MTEEEVGQLLEEARDLHMATIGRDGTPHLVTMWYGLVDGKPVVWTYAKSQKVRNLRRDPRITALVAGGDSYATLRGVMIRGRARLVEDPEGVLEIAEAVHRRNAHRFGGVQVTPEGGSPIDAATREALRVMSAKRVGIVIEPGEVVSWDHRKLGGNY